MTEVNIAEIAAHLFERDITDADVVVILGSGLGDFADSLTDRIDIPYSEISGMPEVTVTGHSGTVHYGNSGAKKVLAFGGRFHSYEGHDMDVSLCLVRIVHELGIKKLIISNAAGGVNGRLETGDLMLINDFMSPGYAYSYKGVPKSNVRYDIKPLRSKILKLAADSGIHLQHGTYFYVKGPTYETKAEVRAYRTMGADVVGMSTAPEMLEATRLGISCIGISLVTNMATGVNHQKLDHSDVKETAESRKEDFARFVNKLIQSGI